MRGIEAVSRVEWCPERATKCESKGVMSGKTHIYILRCADGSYYVGSTDDLEGREKAHNDGRGATYTFLRRAEKMYRRKCTGSLFWTGIPLNERNLACHGVSEGPRAALSTMF